MDRHNDLQKEKIVVSDIHIDADGNRWAFDREKQAVIKLDEGFRRFRYVKGVTESGINLYRPAVETYLDNDVIWIGSVSQPDLLKYDIKTNSFSHIANPLIDNNESQALYDVIKYKQKLFVLARTFKNCSYVFDTETATYTAIHLADKNAEMFEKTFSFYCLKGNTLYLPLLGENKIVKYCLDEISENMVYSIMTLPSEIKIVCMSMQDDNLYISSRGDSDIHIFNADGSYTKINGYDKREGVDFYCQIICGDEYIIALPRHGESVLIYNKSTNKVDYVRLPYSDEVIKSGIQGSLCHEYYISKEDDMLYLFPWEYEFISQINLKTLAIETFDACIDKKDYALYKYDNMKHHMKLNGIPNFICNENEYIDMTKYLFIVTDGIDCEKYLSNRQDVPTGEKIYLSGKDYE